MIIMLQSRIFIPRQELISPSTFIYPVYTNYTVDMTYKKFLKSSYPYNYPWTYRTDVFPNVTNRDWIFISLIIPSSGYLGFLVKCPEHLKPLL